MICETLFEGLVACGCLKVSHKEGMLKKKMGRDVYILF
jgi:hypothetical protein